MTLNASALQAEIHRVETALDHMFAKRNRDLLEGYLKDLKFEKQRRHDSTVVVKPPEARSTLWMALDRLKFAADTLQRA